MTYDLLACCRIQHFLFLFYEENTYANGELDHATLPDAISKRKKY
jgi:hypothetical protein